MNVRVPLPADTRDDVPVLATKSAGVYHEPHSLAMPAVHGTPSVCAWAKLTMLWERHKLSVISCMQGARIEIEAIYP